MDLPHLPAHLMLVLHRDRINRGEPSWFQTSGVMKAPPAGLETMCLDGVLQPDWGGNFLLSEGVEQSGEESSFAFHIHGAVIGIPDSRSFQQLLER